MRIPVRAIVAFLSLSAPFAAGDLPSQAPAERGAFVLRVGTDTVVVERFAWSGDTIQGSLSVQRQPRIDYLAILDAKGLVRSLVTAVFAANAGPDAAPLQRVTITMRGDSAFVEAGTKVQGFATKAGALPILNNSFALAELFTRRAQAMGGTAELPGWALNGGVTLMIQLRREGVDSMVLAVAGQEQRLRVDAGGRILGGVIPSQRLEVSRLGASLAATIKLGLPDYSAPAGAPYTAAEVTVSGPGGITLGGTLTVPTGVTGRVPAVVTITGSGQQDRDEFIPVAGGYRLFRQVADTLGRRGIAVLRLDDRMVGASGGAPGTSADYADDVRAALAFLRSRPEIDGDRLGLVGHSEGGLIAPMVAAGDARLRAIVLLAGPAENGLDIIHFQQRQAIDGDSSIAAGSRDSAYRAAATALDSTAAASPWLKFFLKYDPLATARRVKTATLILHGATDHQVTPEQAPALAAAMRQGGNRLVTLRVFPDLNHLFIHDPSGLPSGYAALSSNRVAPDVLGAIADWLQVQLGASR